MILPAIRDKDKKMLILNGKQRQDHSRNFIHKGTKFVYLVESNGESLSAPGPLIDDVEVMVSFLTTVSQPIHKSVMTI